MEIGESYIDESREYLEPDDGDEGSEIEPEENLSGIADLNDVRVSPYLSSSRENVFRKLNLTYILFLAMLVYKSVPEYGKPFLIHNMSVDG